MTSKRRTLTVAVAATALALTGGAALGADTFTVKEGPTPGVNTGDALTWLTGM